MITISEKKQIFMVWRTRSFAQMYGEPLIEPKAYAKNVIQFLEVFKRFPEPDDPFFFDDTVTNKAQPIAEAAWLKCVDGVAARAEKLLAIITAGGALVPGNNLVH